MSAFAASLRDKPRRTPGPHLSRLLQPTAGSQWQGVWRSRREDLWIFLRRRIRELHLKHFVRAADLGKFLNDLLDFMRRCQDELVGPEKYADYVRRLERGELPLPRVSKKKDADALSDDEVLSRCQEIAQVFSTVERMLHEENLGTFGHMIIGAYEVLARRGATAESPGTQPLYSGG